MNAIFASIKTQQNEKKSPIAPSQTSPYAKAKARPAIPAPAPNLAFLSLEAPDIDMPLMEVPVAIVAIEADDAIDIVAAEAAMDPDMAIVIVVSLPLTVSVMTSSVAVVSLPESVSVVVIIDIGIIVMVEGIPVPTEGV